MRKIIQQISILSIVFLSVTGMLYGKDVNFNLEAPKFVKQGERFKIAFTLNQKPENSVKLPSINKVRTLFGPSVSSSTNIQMINGTVTTHKSFIYSYILLAEEVGKITVPTVSVIVDGKTYKTATRVIEILKNDATVPNSSHNNQQQSSRGNVTKPSANQAKNFFVRVLLSKKNAYPYEHLIATLKLYTRYSGISNADITPPSFKGFISKEIPNSGQQQFTQENISGTIYNTIIVSKYVLFPQHSGELTIDDFSIAALAQQRIRNAQSIFDDFFGNNVQQMRVKATNPKITVKVSPLPSNKPVDYKGAVGEFAISSSLSTDSVAVNEAITLKVKIKGNGNLQMLKAPKLVLSPDLEVYDPKTNNNSGISIGGVKGSTTYEYLIIPRHAGAYEIPAIAFSYFSPANKVYKTVKTKPYTIKVGKGGATSNNANSQAITRYQNNQQDVTNLGNDIKYIMTKTPRIQNKGNYFFNSPLFWIIMLGIPILFVLYLFFNKQQETQHADTLGNKRRKANKVAIKRLRIAKESLKNNEKEAFYTHTLDALWGFVSDKLHLPLSQLNKDNITQHLQEQGVEEQMITEYLDILNACEMAQYTPESSADMSSNYERAVAIISKLEQKL